MGIIRLFLALSVVISHSSPIFGIKFVGSQIAVQAFYIISGFYMALILNEKYIDKNRSYKLFITNRFLRLYPIYWIVLFLTVLSSIMHGIYTKGVRFGGLQVYIDYWGQYNICSFIFLVVTNLIVFCQDIVMFLGLNTSTGFLFFIPDFKKTEPMVYQFLFVPQAWSIGIELVFYLLAPFLVKMKSSILIGISFILLLLRFIIYFYFDLNKDPWTYRFFPIEFMFFLLGILAYRIYQRIMDLPIHKKYLYVIWGFILLFTISFDFSPIKKYGGGI